MINLPRDKMEGLELKKLNNNINLSSFLKFWGLFILLNSILYFQNYVSLIDLTGWLKDSTIEAGSWTGRIHMLFGKNDYHLFKINAEFLLLLSLFFFFKKNNKWLRRLLYFAYIFLFVYNIYFEFNQKFYGIIPAFRNDYILLSEVLPIFINSLKSSAVWSYIISVLILFLLGCLFIYLLKILLRFFEKTQAQKWTQISFAGLWLFTLVYTSVSSYKLENQNLLASNWMTHHILKSVSLDGADKYKEIQNSPYEVFLEQDIAEKPNIYLLFIESYGTVATESDDLRTDYRKQMTEIQGRLENKGFSMASTYSISPIKGGRSWLAFTSFMSGIKVENQVQFNDLIQRNFNYPHLVRYFNQQGYQTYRLSSISNVNADSLIPYARTNRYWGFDEWWTYQDFEYEGFQYDVLGGIPDQYSLGYYRHKISKEERAPKLMFFITMGSHVPWYTPPPLLDDWQALNKQQPGKVLSLVGSDLDRYRAAIQYQLELICRFIESEESNSIFILIGDHQPPGMEFQIVDKTEVAATPLHLISKDSSLITGFYEAGLQKGMLVERERLNYIRHEDFYQLFMEQLLKSYAEQ